MKKYIWITAAICLIAAGVIADQITFSSSDDSWVNGNTSQQGDNYGTVTSIRIRHQNDSWGNNYGVVKFDLSSLTSMLAPGQSVQVTSARIRFFTSFINWSGPTNFSPIAIFKNLEDWNESTVVWTNAPTMDSSAVQTLEYFGLPEVNQVYFTGTNTVDTAAWLEYTDANVAELVEGWLNGTIENYGVSIKATDLVDSDRMFAPQTKEHVNPAIHPAIIVNYTIVEDNGYAKVGTSDDSWVNGSGSSQGVNNGTDIRMVIRHQNDSWGMNYSVAKFDLSSITGVLQPGDTVQVNSAEMRFYAELNNWPGSTNFTPVAMYRNTGGWDESTVVWTNAPPFDPAAVATLDYFGDAGSEVYFAGTNAISSGGWLKYTGSNVASMVENWLNGETDNYGVSLQGTDYLDSQRIFSIASKENETEWLHPEIIINYTVIPDAPPPGSSQIVSANIVSGNVLKLLVDTDSFLLSKQKVVGRASLSEESWVQVGHSDQAVGPFVETNLSHCAVEDGSYTVYVELTNSTGFFGIQ
ncbi:DNRLRE domain-containing protein [Tichowtungia aerotolerans]|uniref:DNRLRE domain-containing protein n=1 Tax=Tichowtungia aerotolerans TaxID=2697043 RepID=A0A6P1MIA9_9BACT|nr:DNRLRE domain-containing protein [Tichowtungia aerotolerans]QHI70785.1 DNRLRE domain-containing protein [Tichowtungia aerotolerans]